MRYRIIVIDVNGRNLVTEDEEDQAREWLWRTLKHLRETWPPGAIFETRISYFEKMSGPDA